jgi:hypothetical protein
MIADPGQLELELDSDDCGSNLNTGNLNSAQFRARRALGVLDGPICSHDYERPPYRVVLTRPAGRGEAAAGDSETVGPRRLRGCGLSRRRGSGGGRGGVLTVRVANRNGLPGPGAGRGRDGRGRGLRSVISLENIHGKDSLLVPGHGPAIPTPASARARKAITRMVSPSPGRLVGNPSPVRRRGRWCVGPAGRGELGTRRTGWSPRLGGGVRRSGHHDVSGVGVGQSDVRVGQGMEYVTGRETVVPGPTNTRLFAS